MIDRFIDVLQAKTLLRKDEDIDAGNEGSSLLLDEDIADMLWLAAQIGGEFVTAELDASEQNNQENAATPTANIRDSEIAPPLLFPAQPPAVPAYLQNTTPEEKGTVADSPEIGLPIEIQKAPALTNARDIERALKPLKRKAPSRTQNVLDERATVNRIAQEDVWIPVLKPASERWFDLELVIEMSPFSFVWEPSLSEFQRLLEHQGAFRNVRTWLLKDTEREEPRLFAKTMTSLGTFSEAAATGGERSVMRSPKELIGASGRSLVLYISDCRSKLWQSGTIHRWLKLWGQHGPTTLAQLLPERLWAQTAMNTGFKVQVSAYARGVANPNLRVHNGPSARRVVTSPNLVLPVITLSAEALKQWARVVMASGQQRLPARWFDMAWVENEERIATADWASIEPQVPAEKLALFQATASPAAQHLARLMSVVPVELAVVHLIQKSFFKDKAEPAHVAEVYDSCLLVQQSQSETRAIAYDFEPGVRALLNQSNPIDETLEVLDVISKEIARTLGFEIDSFPALLLPDLAETEAQQAAILPFARIATGVLHRLGGQYAQLAQQVEEASAKPIEPVELENLVDLKDDFKIPPLKELEFFRAEIREAAPPVQLVMDEFTIATVEFETEISADERLAEIVAIEDEAARAAALIELAPQLDGESFNLLVRVMTVVQAIQNTRARIDVLSAMLPHLPDRLQGQVLELIGELEEPEGPELGVFEFEVASLVPVKASWEVYREPQSAYQFIEPLGDATELEMVAIPAGTFMMGSPESEPERFYTESPQHEVSVAAFFMGRYPITQAQWRFVARLEQVKRTLKADPSRFKGDDRPVERVSWHEAVEFCDRLSRHTGNDYRLPSEAQWEYACRAGTQSPFYFGDTISSELANYRGTTVYNGGPEGEYRGETTSVGYFDAANTFGLSDMHGNVWEWCADHWHSNYEGAPIDGSAWITENEDAQRVRRGGSWYTFPRICRSAIRFNITPDDRDDITGFRVCCLAPRTPQPPTD